MRRRALLGVGCALALAAPTAFAENPRGASDPRLLVVALDAVPYDLVRELTEVESGDEALFAGFRGPVALVSTFPSTTSIALAGLLEPFGLGQSPGYEARFFDWERRHKRGGGPLSYFEIEFPWRGFFDFDKNGLAHRLRAAVQPVRASVRAMDQLLDAFLAGDQPVYFVYVGETDMASHLASPAALVPVLQALDGAIRRARRDHPERPFHTVVFSDHGIAGGEPLVNALGPVKRAVRAAGFRIRDRLDGPRDLVLTPFGLVSSFEVYVEPGQEPLAAAAVAQAEGVDLCAYRAGRTVLTRPPSLRASPAEAYVVESSRGSALFARRPGPDGELWTYRPTTGDPLGYAPLAAALARCSGGAADGWFRDESWLAATRDSFYPDALYRLAASFDLVDNPASLVCSVTPGHMFGAASTAAAARLKGGRLEWTHGALHRDASLGFLLSDLPGWTPPPAARFDRGLRFAALAAPAGIGADPEVRRARQEAAGERRALDAGRRSVAERRGHADER